MQQENQLLDKKLALADNFNRQLGNIIRMAEKQLGTGNLKLYRVKELIKLGKAIDPCYIINNAKDKVWQVREFIEKEDEAYFVSHDYSTEIQNTSNKEFVEELIMMIKTSLPDLKPGEKKYLWCCLKEILRIVIDYMILNSIPC